MPNKLQKLADFLLNKLVDWANPPQYVDFKDKPRAYEQYLTEAQVIVDSNPEHYQKLQDDFNKNRFGKKVIDAVAENIMLSELLEQERKTNLVNSFKAKNPNLFQPKSKL